jgi:hypothetical protein
MGRMEKGYIKTHDFFRVSDSFLKCLALSEPATSTRNFSLSTIPSFEDNHIRTHGRGYSILFLLVEIRLPVRRKPLQPGRCGTRFPIKSFNIIKRVGSSVKLQNYT